MKPCFYLFWRLASFRATLARHASFFLMAMMGTSKRCLASIDPRRVVPLSLDTMRQPIDAPAGLWGLGKRVEGGAAEA